MHLSYLVLAIISLASALQTFDSWGHERIQPEDVVIHFRYSQGGKPPLLLIHGAPQHSQTWIHIGPVLAEKYTVIAPGNRGGSWSADLRAILNFLNINKTFVFAHDKGVGLAASLPLENPELVERMILAEYALPGFGYTTNLTSPCLNEN